MKIIKSGEKVEEFIIDWDEYKQKMKEFIRMEKDENNTVIRM